MKFLLLIVLFSYGIIAKNMFSFNIDSKQVRNLMLEFKSNYEVYQMFLRCDNYTKDLWNSTDYGNIVVTYDQRKQYQCSDKNFTITLSDELVDYETLQIYVYDSISKDKINTFNFINPKQNFITEELKQNWAQIIQIYGPSSDIMINTNEAATIYTEIFSCPYSNPFKTKFYDSQLRYRNIINLQEPSFIYDVFNVTGKEDAYYRLYTTEQQPSRFNFKFQKTTPVELNKIYQYANRSYRPVAEIKKGRLIVQIPTINNLNAHQVYFQIVITDDSHKEYEFLCAYGDLYIIQNFTSNYNTNTYSILQRNSSQSYQQEEFLFPTPNHGWYEIYIAAKINHTFVIQTIPYEKIYIYQEKIDNNWKLIHILLPILIFIFALVFLIFVMCRLKKKKQQIAFEQSENWLKQNQYFPAQQDNYFNHQ